MSNKTLENIILFATLSIFTLYWGSTILFNSPNNYIKIKSQGYVNSFGNFFEQRWNFFAPPPRFNHRLYYSFSHKETKEVRSYEVLWPLLEKKQKNPIFNTQEDVVDYILSGSVININEILYNKVKEQKVLFPENTEEEHQKNGRKAFLERAKYFPEMQTLKNYAIIVAKRYQIEYEKYDIEIILTVRDIPKFKDRNRKEEPIVEKVMIQIPLKDLE